MTRCKGIGAKRRRRIQAIAILRKAGFICHLPPGDFGKLPPGLSNCVVERALDCPAIGFKLPQNLAQVQIGRVRLASNRKIDTHAIIERENRKRYQVWAKCHQVHARHHLNSVGMPFFLKGPVCFLHLRTLDFPFSELPEIDALHVTVRRDEPRAPPFNPTLLQTDPLAQASSLWVAEASRQSWRTYHRQFQFQYREFLLHPLADSSGESYDSISFFRS